MIKKLKNTLMWGFFIQFGTQMTLEIAISLVLNSFDFSFKTEYTGELMSTIMTICVGSLLAVLIIAIPIFLCL